MALVKKSTFLNRVDKMQEQQSAQTGGFASRADFVSGAQEIQRQRQQKTEQRRAGEADAYEKYKAAVATAQHDQESGYRRTVQMKYNMAQPTVRHDQRSGYNRTVQLKSGTARKNAQRDQVRGMNRTSELLGKQIDALDEEIYNARLNQMEYQQKVDAGEAEDITSMLTRQEELQERKNQVDAQRVVPMSRENLSGLDTQTRELLREYVGGKLDDRMTAKHKLRQAGYTNEQIARYAEYEKVLQNYADYRQKAEGARQFGEDAPVLATVVSALEAPLKALGNVESVRGVLPSWAGGYANQDMPTNIYSPWYSATQVSSAMRSGVMQDMGQVGQFLYQTGTSALDSAVNMAVSTGLVGAAGLTGEAASGAIATTMNWVMGSQVAADSVYQGIQSGKSNEQALIDGIVEGAIEGFTETFSAGTIIESMLSDEKVWKRLVRSFGSEGMEEVASNWLNRLYDVVSRRDKNELYQSYAEKLAEGMSEEKALAAVLGEIAAEDGLSFLAGGLSGLAMSGAYEMADTTERLAHGQYALDALTKVLDRSGESGADTVTAETGAPVTESPAAETEDAYAKYSRYADGKAAAKNEGNGAAQNFTDIGSIVAEKLNGSRAAENEDAGASTWSRQAAEAEKSAERGVDPATAETGTPATESPAAETEDAYAKYSRYAGERDARQRARQAEAQQAEQERSFVNEQDRGNAGEGRADGVSAGGTNRTVAESTDPFTRLTQRQGETARLRNRAQDLGAEHISPKEAGLTRGDTTRSLLKIPEAAYGEHEKALRKAVKDRGAELEIVMGKIRLDNGRSVDEFIDLDTRKLVVRADSARWAAEDLIDHALFHNLSQSQQKQVAEEVCRQFSEGELTKIAEEYVRRMRGVYDDLSEEDLLSTAVSEVLADANGRMLRYENADATRFTETVRGIVGGFAEAPSQTQTGQRYSFAGEFARTADMTALEQAKQMEADGASAEDILRETGWYRGADKQWRFEIDDSGMQYYRDGDARLLQEEGYRRMHELTEKWAASMEKGGKGLSAEEDAELERLQEEYEERIWQEKYQLRDFIQHDELFKAYPMLRYYSLVFRKLQDGANGYFDPMQGEIVLSRDLIGDPKKTLIHEIQHAIQHREGFASGASLKYWNERMEGGYSKKNAAGEEMLPSALYRNTAGEIEARDAANRLNLSAEERRSRMPDTGDENTVFVEDPGWFESMDYDLETASIKKQIDNSADELNEMGVVARVTVPSNLKNKDSAAQWAAEQLRSTGYRVDRQGYGEIYFSKKDMDKGLRYADTAEEKAAIVVLPQVLKRGIEIGSHQNHKGRTKQTITFAAPVELNGVRGNMAVVINRNGNHYYAHRIVAPDGRVFQFSEGIKNAAQELPRGVTVSGSLADATSAASGNSIHTNEQKSQEKFSAGQKYSPAEDAVAELDANENAPIFTTAEQTEWAFKEDESRYYRLLGIAPPGSRAGIMKESARAMDWAENGQKYTQELLKEVMQRDDSTARLALKVPDGKGGYTIEAIQNTERMQEVYRLYAEATPEDIRLDESTFWMMQRKLAEGSISSRVQVMSAEEKARAWRASARKDFKSTGALEKLGVKVERSVGKYGQTQALIEMDRAYRQANRELKRAIDRTEATPKEVAFAQQISDGIFSPGDTPQGFDRRVVMTLVDHMNAKAALGQDRILAQRKNVRREITDVMEVLFENAPDGKVSNVLTLNHRTAQRNMRHIFGDELGEKVNRAVFDPVQKNEAERIRFLNKQFDDVRLVEDSKGNKSELTKAESAIVQMTMEGRAAEEMLAGMEMDDSIRRAGERIADGEKPSRAAKSERLNREQKKLANLHASYISALRMMAEGKIDAVKIDNAVQMYQKKYNEFYAAINDFLVAHGYEPIGFIQNYAPHMQDGKTVQSLESALRGLGENVSALPTAIAGKTADFRPNKRWNPYFMRRTGDFTQFDVLSGFESYATYVSDVFYHTDDIMTVRAMSDYLRRRYAPEEISAAIDQYTWLRNRSRDEQLEYLRQTSDRVGASDFLSEEQIEEIINTELEKLYKDAQDRSRYSSLVVWLDNYANILAGKQSMSDRGTEYGIGRGALNLGNYLNRGFGAAKVAGNLATVLNQTSQLPNILGEKGVRNTAGAVWDMASGQLRKADWAQESDYLTSKKGVKFLVTEEQNMYDWTLDRIGQAQQFADAMVSTIAVRAAYREGIRKGMSHEAAMQYADKYGAQVMADRSKGARPVAFNEKNPLSQIVHTFQLEVANSWEHLTQETLGYDFRQAAKEHGKDKATKALAGVIVKTLLAAFFMNRLDDELYGGTPAQFDLFGISANFIASGYGLTVNDALRTVIDNGWEKLTGKRLFGTEQAAGSFKLADALEAAGGDIANDIPYLQNASALIGWGDNSLPMAIPTDALDNWINAVSGGKSAKDIAKKTFDVAAEVVPGGSQIKKTARGLDAMIRGGVYEGYGEDSKLRYPVDNRNIGKWIQAVAFGPNGLSETGRYYAGEERAIGKAQTAAYQAMVRAGAGKEESYRLIRKISKLGEDEDTKLDKLNVLTDSGLPTAAQGAYYYTMLAAEKEQNTINTLTGDGGVIGMDDYLRCKQAQLRLESDEDMKATEKAQEFRAWVNAQGYSAEQKSAILSSFRFYSIAPADSGAHSELYNAAREGTAEYETLRQEAVAAQKAEGKTETDAEAAVNRDMRSQIGQDFKDGVIDEAGAEEMLKEYAGADEDDAYWLLREWKGGSGYKKYGAFLEAVDAGVLEDTKKAAKEYLEHGVEKGTLSSQLTSHFKNRYLEADSEERGRLKALYISAYRAIGGTRDDAVDNMAGWVREAKKN